MTNYSNFFKAYDIRGTVPDLTAELFYWAGFGLVETVLEPENLPLQVNITHDARYSSPEFYKALCKGINDAGGDALPLGVGSTDVAYASSLYNHNPSISLTASHNPKDDNGMKILKKGSTMLGMKEGLDKVRDFVISKMGTKNLELELVQYPIENTEVKNSVLKHFVDKIKEMGQVSKVDDILIARNQKLKIAVDAGNGTGGFVMQLINNLYKNIEFVPLYWDLDGNFPNHPADPQNFENLRDLQREVKNGCDFGFAFDGDADRVFFVDEKSEVINGDFLVAFFAKSLLMANFENPNPKFNPAVVYIQPGSKCVVEAIAESNGIAIPSQQGHTSIKSQMQQYKAIYGGEFSGHHYFADFGYLDSGVLAAVLMIKIVVEKNQKMSTLFTTLKQSYFISDLMNLTIPSGENFEMWKEKLKSAFADATISEFDGISIFYPDWKFSMRSSNTEPKVRFILESRINNSTVQKIDLVKNILGLK